MLKWRRESTQEAQSTRLRWHRQLSSRHGWHGHTGAGKTSGRERSILSNGFTCSLYTQASHASCTLRLYMQALHEGCTCRLHTQPSHSSCTLRLYTQASRSTGIPQHKPVTVKSLCTLCSVVVSPVSDSQRLSPYAPFIVALFLCSYPRSSDRTNFL